MSIKDYKFYNHPKKISIEQYNTCFEQVLEYLLLNFKECTIYKVGGTRIQPGISDIDFLLVHSGKIDGNGLYLREFPRKARRLGVMVHEVFAVDVDTFQWIKRLTTYDLQELHRSHNEKDLLILADQPFYKLMKLVMYIVVNYPMNFISPLELKSVDVRRCLAKLKKLLHIDKLFLQTFNNVSFLNPDLAEEIINISNKVNELNEKHLNEWILNLIQKGNEAVYLMFEVFEEQSKNEFDLNLKSSNINLNGINIDFCSNWRTKTTHIDKYYMPANLSVINQLLCLINSHFLSNSYIPKADTEFSEMNDLGQVWNNYLESCNQNNILTLITDMKFSMVGHNSLKYKVFSHLGNIKRQF